MTADTPVTPVTGPVTSPDVATFEVSKLLVIGLIGMVTVLAFTVWRLLEESNAMRKEAEAARPQAQTSNGRVHETHATDTSAETPAEVPDLP